MGRLAAQELASEGAHNAVKVDHVTRSYSVMTLRCAP